MLEQCIKCKKLISKRATICPKCSEQIKDECVACHRLISIGCISCPECGDIDPFERNKTNIKAKLIIKREKRYNFRKGLYKLIINDKYAVDIKDDSITEIEINTGINTIQLMAEAWFIKKFNVYSEKIKINVKGNETLKMLCYAPNIFAAFKETGEDIKPTLIKL